MKKMAIVSSYNEMCGNATYTEVLRKEFSKYYQVDVLALRTDILASNNKKVAKLADAHIDELAQKLKEYDYVNIQFEAGLYGNSRKRIIRRVKHLISSCNNLTFTMHRIDIAESMFDKEFLKKLLNGGRLFANLKYLRQNSHMAKIYKVLIQYIKRHSRKHNYNIVVHTKREKKNVQQLFGFDRVYDFPITFMDAEMRKREPNETERKEFKAKYHLEENDIAIGLFGFVTAYKSHETVIQALKYLPSNYKILIFGSQHPMSVFKDVTVDPYIEKLLQLIEENSISRFTLQTTKLKGTIKSEKKKTVEKSDAYIVEDEEIIKSSFDKRVFFAGSLSDPEFISALYCCDFAVLPYIETNQSGSGIASLVLESKIKSLYSNNKAFYELQKYFPHCFETFDIGNYSELAYKILNYNKDYREQIDKCLKTYNLENNVLFQKALLEGNDPYGQIQS